METLLLDRNEASAFLEISTRTLDRHISKNTFSIKRKGGKVFLLKSELETWKNERTPEIAHVVAEKMEIQNGGIENVRYQFLYEELKEQLEKKDSLLRQMHYQLGVLETEAKQSVPLLEAEKNHRELEEEIIRLEEERARILASLRTTHRGRIIFFLFALFFFCLSIGFIFQLFPQNF